MNKLNLHMIKKFININDYGFVDSKKNVFSLQNSSRINSNRATLSEKQFSPRKQETKIEKTSPIKLNF